MNRSFHRSRAACFWLLLATFSVAEASTAALPTPSQPILLVQNWNPALNPFSGYLAQILLSEGLVAFQEVQLTDLSSDPAAVAFVQSFETVLLAETLLAPAQQSLFRDYVANGGNLVAMRPGSELNSLFGMSSLGLRAEQLVQFFVIDTNTIAGRGSTPLSLQYHGPVRNCALAGGFALAWLCNSLETVSTNPAVVWNRHGLGQAVAFNFDLARSVVLTRQGNPEWRDSEGDGLSGYRPGDFFTRLNGQAWFAPERIRVPQADEAQRFLANIILSLGSHPLPRLWYLPNKAKALVVNTGDAEGLGDAQLDATINDAASYGGFFTSYLMQAGVAATSPSKEAAWRAAGHEIGPHMYAGGLEGCEWMGVAYSDIVSSLLARFGHGARTARSHTIDWCGWTAMAAIEENHGTGMDLNYYHYFPHLWAYGNNANGYFTGSGLPQPLCGDLGLPLAIYQTATQWPDEWFDNSGYSADEAFEIVRSMIEAAQSGFYSAFAANIHHVRYGNVAGDITHAWANRLWSYARSNGIPLWSAEKLLDFVQARNAARFENIFWNGTTLEFDFRAPVAGQDLTLMIPTLPPGKSLASVTMNGATMPLQAENVRGRPYELLTTRAGSAKIAALYAIATNQVRWVQTSFSAFSSGTFEHLALTEDEDGELRLVPAFYDRFAAESLSPEWISGSWGAGSHAPLLDGANLSLLNPGPGAFVRSQAAFYPGMKVRAKLKFSNGGNPNAPFIYFGLGGEGLVPWMLVGTADRGDGVYTSVYDYRPQDPVLYPLGNVFGEWHVFDIEWQTNQIRFAMDGVLRRIESVSLEGPLYLFFSVAGSTPPEASVAADWVRIERYVDPQGNPARYTSPIFDAGWLTLWQELSWNGTAPAGTSVIFETHSGDNPTVDSGWSDWQALSGLIASPPSRCIQYRVTLGTSDPRITPVVEQVSITGITSGQQPEMKIELVRNALALRWPAWAPGFVPYVTTNLQPPVLWSPLSMPPAITNSQFEVSVPTTNRTGFFRLRGS